MLLTIGMPTYDDYDGLYFTIQALRTYQNLENCELLVVDNTPKTISKTVEANKKLCEATNVRYIHDESLIGPAASKNQVFLEARGDFVLCMDCHVLLDCNSIAKLKKYLKEKHRNPNNLLQGPLLYDDLINVATHFDPIWRDSMYGVWGTDSKVLNNKPFIIPMQGLGLFVMKRKEWPGFNPHFRGFGGEEGYLHEKVRQRGGQTYCLPWLRWLHRFDRTKGVPYRLMLEDRVFNYLVGRNELGLPYDDVIDHFKNKVSEENMILLIEEASTIQPKNISLAELSSLNSSGNRYLRRSR